MMRSYRARRSAGDGNSDIGRGVVVMPLVRSNSTNWWPFDEKTNRTLWREAREVALPLVETVARRQRVLLGLDQGHCDRLGLLTHANAQGVVGPPTGAATSLAADDLDRPEGRLAADHVLGPALRVDGRVDQFGSGICF